MRRKVLSRSIAVTALFLQSLTTIFLHGVTLCIEEGSVELEFALPAECCLQFAEGSAESALHPEECDCTDLSLSHPAVDKKLDADSVVLMPVGPAAVVSTIDLSQNRALGVCSERQMRLPSVDRRTVVLQV